jgi:hypothetical protein
MTSSGFSSYARQVEGDAMSLALNRTLNPGVGRPGADSVEEKESSLNIAVIFTSADATIAALHKAGNLAESLGARITLVVPQIVPYPLPLESPPVLLEFQERRFREIAAESPVEIRVHLYLCRDGMETLKAVLKPHSLIVIGALKRFWPTREKGLARRLRRMGHEIVLTEITRVERTSGASVSPIGRNH